MLKRDISRTNVLIAAAGGMVGSGWLFSPFISAQMAGSGALISWILAAVFMLFIALPLCELGTMFPVSGGMTNYPTYTHGQEVGFLFAWVAWLSYVVMTPIEVQAILQYASHFLPALVSIEQGVSKLSGYGYAVAILIMAGLVVVNSFGIKLLAECNKYASFIKFIIPSIAIVSLLYSSHSLANAHIAISSPQHISEIFTALSAGGIAFAFTGFQNGLILAGEVKNPQRNIPIAILGAIAIGFVLYFMLQLSFLAAIPAQYLKNGWQHLHFPGDSGPLVGLTLLLGLGTVSLLLLLDSSFSPLGTALVYTTATSRILYGMAQNKHLPAFFLKTNRYSIPYFTLFVNFLVGILSFLPLPSWQKMVAFLSSASILSYGIGPICLLAMRKLEPNKERPFRLHSSLFFCQIGFFVCNLMLYWCGFDVISKLYLAIWIGLLITVIHRRKNIWTQPSVIWFLSYMTALLLLSYLGSFGGLNALKFPWDVLTILPFSSIMLCFSQRCLVSKKSYVGAHRLIS